MRRFLFLLCVGLALVAGSGNSFAQTNSPRRAHTQSIDIPKTLSYQGLIAGKDGQPPKDGEYEITVNLYTDKDGSSSVWHATYMTHVTHGAFSLELGSGETVLPAAEIMDGPLFAGIALAGEEMKPLTPLSSVPYAMNVADGAITAKKMGTDYVQSISVNGQKFRGHGADLNIVTDGLEATVDPVTNTVMLKNTANAAHATKGAGAQSNTTITGTLTVTLQTYLNGQTYVGLASGGSSGTGKVTLYSSNSSSSSNKSATLKAADQSSTNTYTIPNASGDASFVLNAGDQSIAGAKTFSGHVHVPTPSDNSDAATKSYVDTHAGGGGVLLDPPSAQTSGTGNSIQIVKGSTDGNFLDFLQGSHEYSWDAVGNINTAGVNADDIGAFTPNGSVGFSAPVHIISNDLDVDGMTSVGGDLTVTGSGKFHAIFSGSTDDFAISETGTGHVAGDWTVGGKSTVGSPTVWGSSTVWGDASVAGNSTVGGDLSVSGTGRITRGLIQVENVVSDLTVGGNVSSTGGIFSGDGSGLTKVMASSLSGNIDQGQVNGLAAALTAKANDNNVVHLTGDETISGVKTFHGYVIVETDDGGSNISVGSLSTFRNTQVNGDLSIFGLSSSGSLGTYKDATHTGNASIAGDINVDGTATVGRGIGGSLTHTGQISWSISETGNGHVAGDWTIGGSSTVGGDLSVAGTMRSHDAQVVNNMAVGGDAVVSGNVSATHFIGNGASGASLRESSAPSVSEIVVTKDVTITSRDGSSGQPDGGNIVFAPGIPTTSTTGMRGVVMVDGSGIIAPGAGAPGVSLRESSAPSVSEIVVSKASDIAARTYDRANITLDPGASHNVLIPHGGFIFDGNGSINGTLAVKGKVSTETDLDCGGTVSANRFSGNGSGLTHLPVSQLSLGNGLLIDGSGNLALDVAYLGFTVSSCGSNPVLSVSRDGNGVGHMSVAGEVVAAGPVTATNFVGDGAHDVSLRESSAPSVSEVVVTKSNDIRLLTHDQGNIVLYPGSTHDLMINGFSLSSGGDNPMESLSLNFTKVKYDYTPGFTSSRTVSTIPNTGGDAEFVMDHGDQTIGGTKFFNQEIDAREMGHNWGMTHDQVAGKTLVVARSSATMPGLVYTLPDAGKDADFVMTEGDQTLRGTKTFQDVTVSDIVTGRLTFTDPNGVSTFTQGVDAADSKYKLHTGFIEHPPSTAMSVTPDGNVDFPGDLTGGSLGFAARSGSHRWRSNAGRGISSAAGVDGDFVVQSNDGSTSQWPTRMSLTPLGDMDLDGALRLNASSNGGGKVSFQDLHFLMDSPLDVPELDLTNASYSYSWTMIQRPIGSKSDLRLQGGPPSTSPSTLLTITAEGEVVIPGSLSLTDASGARRVNLDLLHREVDPGSVSLVVRNAPPDDPAGSDLLALSPTGDLKLAGGLLLPATGGGSGTGNVQVNDFSIMKVTSPSSMDFATNGSSSPSMSLDGDNLSVAGAVHAADVDLDGASDRFQFGIGRGISSPTGSSNDFVLHGGPTSSTSPPKLFSIKSDGYTDIAGGLTVHGSDADGNGLIIIAGVSVGYSYSRGNSRVDGNSSVGGNATISGNMTVDGDLSMSGNGSLGTYRANIGSSGQDGVEVIWGGGHSNTITQDALASNVTCRIPACDDGSSFAMFNPAGNLVMLQEKITIRPERHEINDVTYTIPAVGDGGSFVMADASGNVSFSGNGSLGTYRVNIGSSGQDGVETLWGGGHSNTITQDALGSNIHCSIPVCADGSKFVMLNPSGASNLLPDQSGNTGKVLSTNGTGTLSWISSSASYTDAEARAAIAPEAPLAYNSSNQLVMPKADPGLDGYLSHDDWAMFNAKLPSSASGAQTTSTIAATISNTATSSTASITRTGLAIATSGSWSGLAATSTGLSLSVAGGTSNMDIAGTNSNWSVTSAGAVAAASGKFTGMKAPVSGSGTSASHGTAYAGQASFTWASGSPNTGTSIVGTIYNDNITGSSIVLFNLQGAASGSGVWVGDITTAPNGTNHNFTVTLQRRVSATLTTNDQCTVNYEIIN